MLHYINLENGTVLHLRKLSVNVYHECCPDSLIFFLRTTIYLYMQAKIQEPIRGFGTRV